MSRPVKKAPPGTVTPGERRQVTFGKFEGEAGVVDRGVGLLEVAFAAAARDLRGLEVGEVDGKAVTVLSIEKAKFVPGLVVVTCRLAAAPGARS